MNIYIYTYGISHCHILNYRRLTVARSCRASGTLWQYHMACFFKKRLHCRATLKARPRWFIIILSLYIGFPYSLLYLIIFAICKNQYSTITGLMFPKTNAWHIASYMSHHHNISTFPCLIQYGFMFTCFSPRGGFHKWGIPNMDDLFHGKSTPKNRWKVGVQYPPWLCQAPICDMSPHVDVKPRPRQMPDIEVTINNRGAVLTNWDSASLLVVPWVGYFHTFNRQPGVFSPNLTKVDQHWMAY